MGKTEECVLMTGVTGFIGSHTTVRLLNEGYRVRGSMRNLGRADAIRSVIAEHAPVEKLEFVEADLLDPESWKAAVEGCPYVLHLASPFPAVMPKDHDELVVPARQGTLNVMEAAAEAGVKRVVLMSSAASVAYGHDDENRAFDETDWTNTDDPDRIGPYVASKTLAERAAWEFVAREDVGIELTTLNPPFVLGPVLERDFSSSLVLLKKPLDGEVPGVPKLPINTVDVRDVADALLLAMTHPDAPGERFIPSGEFKWYIEIIDIIREHFPDYRKKLPKFQLPNLAVRLFALVDSETRSVLGDLGKHKTYDTTKIRTVLGWECMSVEQSVKDTVQSLIDYELI